MTDVTPNRCGEPLALQGGEEVRALGARWGIFSEESFRNAVKEIAEKEFGARVERWTRDDERGYEAVSPSVKFINLNYLNKPDA
jgi:hypothetical protein